MARPGMFKEGFADESLEGEVGSAGGQHSAYSSVPGTASWSAGENDSGGTLSASSLVPLRGCVGDGGTASWSAGENDSGGKMSGRGCVGDGVVAVATLEARLESYVFTLDKPTLRMRMQVRAKKSLNCLRYGSLIFPRRLVSP